MYCIFPESLKTVPLIIEKLGAVNKIIEIITNSDCIIKLNYII